MNSPLRKQPVQVAKQIIKQIPGVEYLHERWLVARERRSLMGRSAEDVFNEMFRRNGWGGVQSVSGRGSDPDQTRVIATELSKLLAELRIADFLDVPCGDFRWMQTVDRGLSHYLGGDIVPDLVAENRRRYGSETVRFDRIDLMRDDLPVVDLVLCRDCLVHFSFRDIFEALRRLCKSGSKYLLTTTFDDRASNTDIVTGQWRPLNLSIAPFNLPAPMRLINEKCTEGNGRYRDKSLGLWELRDVANCLPA